MDDLMKDLRNQYYAGVMQHMRSWSEINRIHEEAAASLEARGAMLRECVEALEAMTTHFTISSNAAEWDAQTKARKTLTRAKEMLK